MVARVALFSILLFTISQCSSAWAYTPSQELEAGARSQIEGEGTRARKLQRGFLNVVLSPLEISKELSDQFREDTFPPSWFTAIGKGAGFMVIRAAVGVYEIVTFAVPLPGNYEPLLQPEFPMTLAEPKKKNKY